MDGVRTGAALDFAGLLRQNREAAGLTQEALAERAGLSARTVSDLERGLKHQPRHETLELLATALALSPEQRTTFRALGRAQVMHLPSPSGDRWVAPPEEPEVFLSYARDDSAIAEQLKVDLCAQGINCWMSEHSLHEGTTAWEQAQRAAIRACRTVLVAASPSTCSSRSVLDELRLAELYLRPVCALWLEGEHWMECIPIGWGGLRCVDARGARYRDALTALSELVSSRPTPPAASIADGRPRNPYKGLRAFTGMDAGDFFGREPLIDTLLHTLQAPAFAAARLLALVGPSGSGKSSVLMAGLIPHLRKSTLPESDNWIFLDPLLPGTHPLEALTITLSTALPSSSLRSIRADLDHSTRGLHLLARRITGPGRPRVVLVLDQFEEIFTLTSDEDERRHFIELLVTAVSEPAGPVLALITLRADFYDRPMHYPALGALLEARSVSVLPMSPADLRRAIELPAALPDVGLSFERDLVGDLLFEVLGQPGALPLLAFTLEQLFARREGRNLTLAAYRELGGVQGALTRHAETTYAGLPSPEHQQLARALFLRLIDPGATEQETTRRRAELGELRLRDEGATARMRQTADAFIAARLVVTTSASTERQTTGEKSGTIEVSHEALIREWIRLGDWLREARDDVRVQQRLSADAGEWLRRNRPVDNLYRGQMLDEAHAWAERNTPSAEEMSFLTAGLQERGRREVAEQEQQLQRVTMAQQVAVADRRAASRLRYLAAVLAAALIVATSLTVFALKNAHDADVATRAAQLDGVQTLSRQLAAEAVNHLGDAYDLALLLSVAAERVADTFEARDSVLRTLAYKPQLVTYLHQGAAGETVVAFSPDGRTMASGGCGLLSAQNLCLQGEVRIWDVAHRRVVGTPLRISGGAIYSLAFSPDGRTLAGGAFDGSLRIWDVKSRKLLGAPIRNGVYRCFGVAFSPNGADLACAGIGSVVFWNIHTRRLDGAPLLTQADAVPSMAFNRDGRLLATGANDGSNEIWDVRRRRGALLPPSSASSSVYGLAFSPNGSLLATGGLNGTVQIWDTTHLRLLSPLGNSGSGQVNALTFDPSGAILAIGSADGMVRLWDVTHDRWFPAPLIGGTGSVSSLSFSPDGRLLASGTAEGTIQFWNFRHTDLLGTELPGRTAGVNSIAFSGDGQIIASGNDDGSIHLWDAASGHTLGPPLRSKSGTSVQSVAFTHSGRILASGNDDGSIQLWDVSRRRALGPPLRGHTGGVTALAFSPDGQFLVSGSADTTIRLWRVADGRQLRVQTSGHRYGVTGIAFSPNGRTLVSVGYDETIRFWSVPQLKPSGVPFGHTQAILSLAFSPDGRTLATGSQDGSIWFWSVAARTATGAKLIADSGGVTSLAFSPDGSMLASAGEDQTVQIWDTIRRQEIGPPLTGHTATVTSVAFSHDGRILASGSQDGTVRITNTDHTAWLDQACRIADRELTPAEWQQYLGNRKQQQLCPAAA